MTRDGPRAASSFVTHLWLHTDDDGESHFALRPLIGDADPEAAGSELLDEGAAAGYGPRVVPPGWARAWGRSKERTLAVYIAGEA